MENKLVSKKIKLTKTIMEECLKSKKSHNLKWFKKGRVIEVNNRMQKNYTYTLTFNNGCNLEYNSNEIKIYNFKPQFTPCQMLNMGIFEGKYCNDQIFEFPKEWFNLDKLSPEFPNPKLNYFKIKSRLNLQEWISRSWIPCGDNDMDTRGWFEWYCRYWLGRRQDSIDIIQIKRWNAFKRHYAQYLKNTKGYPEKHPKRRQALLQWSYPCIE
jgi:hypothetical protein